MHRLIVQHANDIDNIVHQKKKTIGIVTFLFTFLTLIKRFYCIIFSLYVTVVVFVFVFRTFCIESIVIRIQPDKEQRIRCYRVNHANFKLNANKNKLTDIFCFVQSYRTPFHFWHHATQDDYICIHFMSNHVLTKCKCSISQFTRCKCTMHNICQYYGSKN